MAHVKGPAACDNGASDKRIAKPTPKSTTIDSPAAQALDKALKAVSDADLVEVHRHVKSAWEAGVEALQVVHFVLHDPATAGLRRDHPWLSHSATVACEDLRQLDRSTEVLMDVFGPLVTSRR